MGENNFSFYIFIIIAVISIINKFRKKDAANNKKTPNDGFFKKKMKITTFYNSRGQAIGKTEKEIESNNDSTMIPVQQQRNSNNSPIKNETNLLSSKLEKFLIKTFNIPEDNPTPVTASSTQNNEYNQTYNDDYEEEEDYSSNEANEVKSSRKMSNLELARSEEYETKQKKKVRYSINNLLNSKNDMRRAILLAEIVNRKY